MVELVLVEKQRTNVPSCSSTLVKPGQIVTVKTILYDSIVPTTACRIGPTALSESMVAIHMS